MLKEAAILAPVKNAAFLLVIIFIITKTSYGDSTDRFVTNVWQTIHTWPSIPPATLNHTAARKVWFSHQKKLPSCSNHCQEKILEILNTLRVKSSRSSSVESRGLNKYMEEQYGNQKVFITLRQAAVSFVQEMLKEKFSLAEIISFLSLYRHLISQQNSPGSEDTISFGKACKRNVPLITSSAQFTDANAFLTNIDNQKLYSFNDEGLAFGQAVDYFLKLDRKIIHSSRLQFVSEEQEFYLAEMYWSSESDQLGFFEKIFNTLASYFFTVEEAVLVFHGCYLMSDESLVILKELVEKSLNGSEKESLDSISDFVYLVANFTFIERGGGFLSEVLGESLRSLRFPHKQKLFDSHINIWGAVISSPSNLDFREKLKQLLPLHNHHLDPEDQKHSPADL